MKTINPAVKENRNAFNRKDFIELVVKGVSALAISPLLPTAKNYPLTIKAIAFDAFALFDTGNVVNTAKQLFPDKAHELMLTWRTKQFEYTWLRGLSKQYKDFSIVTADALTYSADILNLKLPAEKKERLIQSLSEMKFTADACTALRQIKSMSIRLSILSNATPTLLNTVANNSGMHDLFDFIISTDSIMTYKPDPAAYQLAIDAFGLNKQEILFVAFGGWDAAGAKSFGFPTVWVNKLKLPREQLDITPDLTCENLFAVPSYVKTIIT